MNFRVEFLIATDWMIRENERDVGDAFPPVDIACCGFVVDEQPGEDGYVAISTEVVGKGLTCRHVLTIPNRCIRARKTLDSIDLKVEEAFD